MYTGCSKHWDQQQKDWRYSVIKLTLTAEIFWIEKSNSIIIEAL